MFKKHKKKLPDLPKSGAKPNGRQAKQLDDLRAMRGASRYRG